jgi:transposase-like protein
MSQSPKRTFDREFKLQVVRQLKSGEKRLAQVCREHNLCQTLVRRWREQYEQKGENAWLEQAQSRHVAPDDKARIAALEAALPTRSRVSDGRAHLELDFLRHCLRVLEQKGALTPVKSAR